MPCESNATIGVRDAAMTARARNHLWYLVTLALVSWSSNWLLEWRAYRHLHMPLVLKLVCSFVKVHAFCQPP